MASSVMLRAGILAARRTTTTACSGAAAATTRRPQSRFASGSAGGSRVRNAPFVRALVLPSVSIPAAAWLVASFDHPPARFHVAWLALGWARVRM